MHDTRPEDEFDRMARRRSWITVLTGVSAGVLVAILCSMLVRRLADMGHTGGREPVTASLVDFYRLPSGRDQALLVLRAGPDASGEQTLSRRLFPGETPERELATVLVANASSDEPWDVDLEQSPLRLRTGDGSTWEPFVQLAERLDGASDELTPADRLRLRGLGAGTTRFRLEPRSARQVLLALPPARRFEQVSDVQWGDTLLRRDHADVERLRALRQDPSAAGTEQ